MATSVFLWTVSVIPLTFILVFAMKYMSAAVQARVRSKQDAGYRALAEAAVAAQAEVSASLNALQSELLKVSKSLAAVESILKQVE